MYIGFEDFEDFCEWFANVNSAEALDMHEAMTVYYNLDTYEEVI